MFRSIIWTLGLVFLISPLAMGDPVPTSDAYVVEQKAVTKQAALGGYYAEITVRVKVKRAGTYVVAAGFVKDNKFHVGAITGNKFWDSQTVTLGENDEQVVVIKANVPPLNRKWTADVFRSRADIPTTD